MCSEQTPTEAPQVDLVVAVDVGGMSIKRGLVSFGDGGAPSVESLPAQPIDATASADVLLAALRSAIDPLLRRAVDGQQADVLALGVAFPGPMDYERGIPAIRGQRKFDNLCGVDLRAWATTAWPDQTLDVRFVNDAEAAALGESIAGASRSSQRSLMVTLGTGFGAAAVVDGCGALLVGGVNVQLLFEALVEDHGRADDVLSAVGLAALLGVPVDGVAGAAQAAREGDVAISSSFEEFGRRLGRFLAGHVRAMNMDVLVIGGGAGKAFDLFAPSLRAEVRAEVHAAALGEHAPLIGAAAFTVM
ncbi:ROK family protein [Ilumatobacter sp.]|uniref:ROK family protein n=1 Tax=Ilumatobacter sp. TaxID=1967498 RepID=UPI003750BCCC